MQLLRRKIARFIRENRLLCPGDKVIVALSGGADSVALLDVLANLPGYNLTLIPAHLNHLLRGGESEGDEEFVRTIAAGYGLTPEVARVDVAASAAGSGLSLEEAGREARYAFFRELALRIGATKVAIAHHRDDQAETVLLRLLRGSAGSGLAAMRPGGDDGLLVRPLLEISRREIEAYLQKSGIGWREDSSNLDTRFLRNRVRHELIPLLRDYNPRIVESLCQTAAALAGDEEVLEAVTADAFSRCVIADIGSCSIDLGLMEQEMRAIRPRIYRLAIAAAKGDLRRITFRHLAAVERLATGGPPNGRVELPGGLRVAREYGRLLFCVAGGEEPGVTGFSLFVEGPGRYPLPGGASLLVEEFPSLPEDWKENGRDILWTDPGAVPLPWEVRSFRRGDRFRPMGMSGEKKLKDLFIDRKIPLARRRLIPLFLSRGEIFWVGGVQPAACVATSSRGVGVLRVRILANPE